MLHGATLLSSHATHVRRMLKTPLPSGQKLLTRRLASRPVVRDVNVEARMRRAKAALCAIRANEQRAHDELTLSIGEEKYSGVVTSARLQAALDEFAQS